MELLLLLLISDILTGALAYVNNILTSIVPIALHAEQYMASLTGRSWFEEVYNLIFSFGVSLIVLKFLKKGFDTYISWTDGDPDADPVGLLTGFLKAMIVAIGFPTMYGWLAQIVSDLTDKLLVAIGASTSENFATYIGAISSGTIFTGIVSLIFFILFFLLYLQFLMRGLEILILRIGVPIACVGLLDSDKGVFGAYIKKFFQSTLAVVLQITLAKLAVGMLLNSHIFWGVAAMMLALKTPRFLQDFVLAGGGGSITNNIYSTSRMVQMVRGVFKK